MYDIVVWPTSQLVYYCGYVYVSLSGFLTMHPDLVLLTSFSCKEALLSRVPPVPLSWLLSAFLLYCSMSASPWTILLVVCSLHCSFVLFMLLTLLVVYIAGFLLILFRISASGSVFMLDCSLDWCCRYISDVTVLGFYVPSVFWNASAIFCELNNIWAVMVVVVAQPTMGPCPPSSCWTLQLSLWEYLKILLKYHCHFCLVYLLICCDGHHDSPVQ